MKTVVQAAISSLVGFIVFGLLVFGPAGTFHYWQGWAFIAVFAAATLIPSAYLAVKNPGCAAPPHAGGPRRRDQAPSEIHHRGRVRLRGRHDRGQCAGLPLRLVDRTRRGVCAQASSWLPRA